MNRNESDLCPVCGEKAQLHTERQGMRLMLCQRCGHRFSLIPMARREVYDARYHEETHRNFFEHPDLRLYRRFLDIVRGAFPKGSARVLDAGCGKGGFLEFLARSDPGLSLTGIDFFANDHPSIEYLQGDILSFDFGERRFDAICSIGVIEHVEDPEGMIRRSSELLRPGGVLALATVDCDGLMMKAAEVCDRLGMHAPFDRIYFTHHFHHFSQRSLRMLAERHGLEVTWQRCWRYQLAAVDVPRRSGMHTAVYLAGTAAIFALSRLLGREMVQVLAARKCGSKQDAR